MTRPVLLATLAAFVLFGAAATGATISVSITPNQPGLVEGDTVTFTVVGDDAGWVKVYCTQPATTTSPGGTYEFPGGWYYPFYGYYGMVVLDVPDPADNGQPMSCDAHYLDYVGNRSKGCSSGYVYPPILSFCTRTKDLGSVSFGVGHS